MQSDSKTPNKLQSLAVRLHPLSSNIISEEKNNVKIAS